MTDKNNYDTKTGYQIAATDFKQMIQAVANYIKTNKNTPPNLVFIRLNKVKQPTYLSYKKYIEMKTRWTLYIKENKAEPRFIWINKPGNTPAPKPTPSTLGPIQTRIQQGTGKKFTNFTEFYNLVLKYCTYSYYFDNQKTLNQEIDALISSFNGKDIGQNCVDYAQIGSALAKEMGYTPTLYGVYCPVAKINHAIFTIKGKEFTSETIIDLAACASDSYPLGRCWCDWNQRTKNPSWLPYE